MQPNRLGIRSPDGSQPGGFFIRKRFTTPRDRWRDERCCSIHTRRLAQLIKILRRWIYAPHQGSDECEDQESDDNP